MPGHPSGAGNETTITRTLLHLEEVPNSVLVADCTRAPAAVVVLLTLHMCTPVSDCSPPQVVLTSCEGSSEIGWIHSSEYQLVHHSTGLCLDSEKVWEGHTVVADVCDASKASQTWRFSLQLNHS